MEKQKLTARHAVAKITKNLNSELKAVNGEVRKTSTKSVIFVKTAN